MRHIIQLRGHQRLVEGRHGSFVYNLHDHYVGKALEFYGEYCEPEIQLFLQLISVGGDVIEIGANIGTHTVPLARAPSGARVHAFEPQPVVFQNLCANLSVNCCENVLAWPMAVSSERGRLIVPAVDYGQAGNFGAVSLAAEGPGLPVEVTTLDSYAADLASICLIKADVEGMEREVLLGAKQTIQRCRPILYLENDRVKQSKALIETCWELGYRLYWHTPMLYNPDNFFGNPENIYVGVAAFNMLCVPNESAMQVTEAQMITDSGHHPLL